MSRSLGTWQAILLGSVVVAGLSLGAAGLFAVGNRSWVGANPLEVKVGFDGIRGVEVGTRVRIQGIDAGEVVAIDPPTEPGQAVQLRLRLRGDLRHLVLAGSTVQIVSEGLIGAKVLEIRSDGIQAGTPEATAVADGATLRSRSVPELSDVLRQVNGTLQALRAGEGTLGKLATDQKAYDSLVKLLEQSRETMTAIQQDAEAVRRLPVVGKYVEDPINLLVRPKFERHRQTFAEEDLFEPGRAVLTDSGAKRLDELAPWFAGLKQKGSEVVIVSYADPKSANPAIARALTRQQSEVVADYLTRQHAIHKLGWFSSRKVIPLGLGTSAPPIVDEVRLPPARTEVLIFTPQA